MSVQMNIAEAKAKLSELVTRAENGEEVLIARAGKPAVRLVVERPRVKGRRRAPGAWAHLGKLEDPYLFLRPDPELEEAADGPIFPAK